MRLHGSLREGLRNGPVLIGFWRIRRNQARRVGAGDDTQKMTYSGSSSVPSRSCFGVAMSPSSGSSSGTGGGFFDLSSAFFGGSFFLPLPMRFPPTVAEF